MPRNREKQQFVSASGTMQRVIEAVANAVYDRGGDDNDLRQVLDEDGLMKQAIAKQVMELAVPQHSWHGATFQVESCGRSSEQLVSAGEYSSVDDRIRSRNVSPPMLYSRTLRLLHFERAPTLDQVNRACERTGAPTANANMWDLEIFGADYSRAPRPGSHLIALGSLRKFSEEEVMHVGCLSISLQSSRERELRYLSLDAAAQLPNEDCYYLMMV